MTEAGAMTRWPFGFLLTLVTLLALTASGAWAGLYIGKDNAPLAICVVDAQEYAARQG